MTGQAGIQVRIRFMPHHDHRIEVHHAATGRYLGSADLADQATDEQISAVRRARSARARRLKKDLEASQRERYAAVNQPAAPQRLGALTTAQAEAELAQTADTEHQRQAGRAGHDGRHRHSGVVLLASSPPKKGEAGELCRMENWRVLRLRLVRDAVRRAHEPNDPYEDNATAFTDEGESRRSSRYPARRADTLGFADAHTAPGHPHCPEHWWKVFRDQRTA